jgi:hypothetical protein
VQLSRAVRPIEGRCHIVEPIAAGLAASGYGRWGPDDLVAVLRGDIERLSRTAEEACADVRLPEPMRRGLALIIVELLGRPVAESTRQLVP